MDNKKQGKNKKQARGTAAEAGALSYRLKCAKTANGLSHFVMYGDVKKDKSLL